jgi:hypothetical protein
LNWVRWLPVTFSAKAMEKKIMDWVRVSNVFIMDVKLTSVNLRINALTNRKEKIG